MAARAIWKAVLKVDAIELPVKLYSGVRDSSVHFRLLHDRDRVPVKQKMVTGGGKPVASEQVEKGAPVGPGRYVILSDDELAAVEPEDSRTIEVFRVIPSANLDHAYYDRAYWLAPTGSPDAYWALVEALGREPREGIARWVMRKRAYLGALRVRDDHLVLITLRHLGEVVEPAEIKPPSGRTPDSKELAMARQLVGMLEGRFDPDDYRDEYRDRVLELLRRKARGEKIPTARPTTKKAPSDLAAALRQSLAAGGARQPAARTKRRAAHG